MTESTTTAAILDFVVALSYSSHSSIIFDFDSDSETVRVLDGLLDGLLDEVLDGVLDGVLD